MMKHEPAPDPATIRADVTIVHKLHRDYETRSRVDLRKVGAAVYAADPSTEIICAAYAIDDGPVRQWRPGDPVPPEWFEAAANPDWVAVAHNDAFESAIEQHILHPRHGFPLVPPDRHRCTQAMGLALGLPAKLGLLADVLELTHRKDAVGERLMHQTSKPRRPRFGEDPDGIYWFEDPDRINRLGDYNVQDVEVEREADDRLLSLSDAEQALWVLSNTINARGFHIDRPFAEAARKIAKAAAPEIDAEIAAITDGAVTAIGQIAKMVEWLKAQGCETSSLDRKTIEQLLSDDELEPPARRVLELRLGGAQAAVKKLDALLARAGSDDRIRGAFRFHGASTGRWAGEGFQPQNLKRPMVNDLDAAIAAVATGDYAHMKSLFSQPLAVVGDCSRSTITAAANHELIGADLSSIESRVLALVAGEEWKINSYRRYDASHDPRDEPYCSTAAKIFGVPDGTYTKASPERAVGKTCDLAFGYAGGLGAWRNFEPDKFTDEQVETFKTEWRANHPKIVQFWHNIDRAAVEAVHDQSVKFVCGPVVLNSDGLAKDGDPLVYGPVDVTVGSPERLVYEGEVSVGKGLERLPRISAVLGGAGMLCAAELIAFADQHAPVKRFNELVEQAKLDPAFLAEQAAVKAAYRADHIEKAVARGGVREDIEKEFDRTTRAAGPSIGGRIWRELSPHHTLYWPDGVPFTAADMAADPKAFHGKECCDPVEGMDYQTRNCGFILHRGGRVEIYSRAHGDRYAYFLKLLDEDDLGALTGPGGNTGGGGGAGVNPGAGVASANPGVSIKDFHAYMPTHNYIFAPSGEIWVEASVNSRLPRVPMFKKNGAPLCDENGNQKHQAPTSWLDKHRAVEQMTWAPGMEPVIGDRLIAEGGWFTRKGCNVFNLYKPPVPIPASVIEPTFWLNHVHKIYPDDADHIVAWLAHRVQRPEEKINHALVLGGNQGIGKDTILEPVKRAIGSWNFGEVSPKQAFGRFNGFLKSVILRVSEARDLGEYDRFAFYDHMKVFTAAPPDVLRIDEKNLREHSILNVVGVIITTNHKSNGIYLPADDRRHYVAWSNFDKSQFTKAYWNEIWQWYAAGGLDIVARYLTDFDLEAAGFDPKAPPPQTEAFWEIVNASSTPEDAEMADALDELARRIERERLTGLGVEGGKV